MKSIIGNLRCLYRRLFFRIGIDILLLIIIPAAFSIALLVLNLRENIRSVTLSKIEDRLKDKAAATQANLGFVTDDLSFVAKHLERHFSGLGGGLKDVAHGIPPRDWYRAARYKNFMDDLETMLLMNKGFLKVRVINSAGREIIRFDRTPSGVKEVPYGELEDKSGRDYFIAAMAAPAGKTYVHPITLDVEHGKIMVPHTPVLRLCRKITADGGATVAVLVLTVDPDTIFGFPSQSGPSESMVIDETGGYLHHRDPGLTLGGESAEKANLFDEIPQLKVNQAKYDNLTIFDSARGEYRVWRKIFYRQDDRAHFWVFVERHPEFSIISGYTDILARNARILLLVILGGGALVMVVIYRSLRPLQDVTAAIRKLGAGDMAARAPAGPGNEIGEIADAFNTLTDGLNKTALELQRTMALAKSISDIAPTAHIIADAAGTIISVNPAAELMFGYAAGELTGKNVKILVPSHMEDEYSKYIHDYLEFKKTGSPEKRKVIRTPKEVIAIRKNGEIFYSSLFIKEAPLADEDVFAGIIEDITERRETRIALMESAENSEAIMNASSETLGLIGLEGNIIAINEAGAQRLGAHHRHDLIGKSLYQILPLELALKRMEYFDQAARTAKPLTYEDERNGRFFSSSVYPVIDKDGLVTRCALFAVDITERKQWEERLAEREAKMRAVLVSVPDAVILIDEKGTVEMINPAGARIFGWAAEDVIGQNVTVLMPEPYQSEHGRYIGNYLQSGEKKALDRVRKVSGLRRDGSVFPAELYVTELWLGQTRKFLGIVRDISERKRAEEALHNSMENLAKAQQIAHLGSWELDIATYTPSWSDETFRILGFEPGEVVPSFDIFMNCIHPDDRKAVRENLQAAMDGGELPAMEQRIVRKNGDERTVKVQGMTVRNEKGTPVRFVGTAHDITELKELERIRDNFFHAVVHDLKSPMTGIKLELDMLYDQIISFSKECATREASQEVIDGYESSLKQKVADIHEGIDQLHLMIQSLLKLGEMEEEKLELHYEAFAMNDLLGELEHDFKGRAAAKGLTLEFRNAFAGTVIADFRLLKRVLQNLVDNALKYSLPNTTITVDANCMKKQGTCENIIVSVTNTGHPLTENKINTLFQKFKTLGHAESGSGIGLFFCYKTMNMLGGGIYVDQDAGTITFHIFFPNA